MKHPTATLVPARPLTLPSAVDSNSPAHWDGDELYVFTSHPQAGVPHRHHGADLFTLGRAEPVSFDREINGDRWIESCLRAEDGRLYGWYHNEPKGICPDTHSTASVGELTAPRVGALVSNDNGATWQDLGLVITAATDALDCAAQNGYFAGGHGDFSVMLDEAQEYLYIFYGSYAGEPAQQGVAVARMHWGDRDAPAGKVWKWHEGRWDEPGAGGGLTPIFPPTVDWRRADCDALWGPSAHRNEHLEGYVLLLNRARGRGWTQEGIYAGFTDDLADPHSWSEPTKILDNSQWYPQVIGLEKSRGTDKSVGHTARFFIGGVSEFDVVFDA